MVSKDNEYDVSDINDRCFKLLIGEDKKKLAEDHEMHNHAEMKIFLLVSFKDVQS